MPAKAAADKPGKPVNVKAPVQPKKQADDRKKANVKRAKTAYIFFTAEKRAPVKGEVVLWLGNSFCMQMQILG